MACAAQTSRQHMRRNSPWATQLQARKHIELPWRIMRCMTPSHAHLLDTLAARFAAHPARHRAITWQQVHARLQLQPTALHCLQRMEDSGGEPDVIAHEAATGQLLFVDCATESPAGRRSLCFDAAALQARKANPPAGSAADLAADMGIALLDEADYQALQALGEFDLKTSSWLATPPALRALGGALFGDRRYGRVFTYHNGASSYYAARGFRGKLWV